MAYNAYQFDVEKEKEKTSRQRLSLEEEGREREMEGRREEVILRWAFLWVMNVCWIHLNCLRYVLVKCRTLPTTPPFSSGVESSV